MVNKKLFAFIFFNKMNDALSVPAWANNTSSFEANNTSSFHSNSNDF